MAWLSADKRHDLGLLFMRVGIGVMFIIAHGLPKLMGGPKQWEVVGSAMSHLGIDAVPALWGFLATLAELVGGLLLIVGKWVRPAAAAMLATMLVAALQYLIRGEGFFAASRPIEMAIFFAGLIFLGGGKYGIDGRRG